MASGFELYNKYAKEYDLDKKKLESSIDVQALNKRYSTAASYGGIVRKPQEQDSDFVSGMKNTLDFGVAITAGASQGITETVRNVSGQFEAGLRNMFTIDPSGGDGLKRQDTVSYKFLDNILQESRKFYNENDSRSVIAREVYGLMGSVGTTTMTRLAPQISVPLMWADSQARFEDDFKAQGLDITSEEVKKRIFYSTAIEVGSEYIFDIFDKTGSASKYVYGALAGRKVAYDAIEYGAGKLYNEFIQQGYKKTLLNQAVFLVSKGAEEGFEEGVSELGAAIVAKFTTDPQAKLFSGEDPLVNPAAVGKAMLYGGLMGFVYSTSGHVASMFNVRDVLESLKSKPFEEWTNENYAAPVEALNNAVKDPKVQEDINNVVASNLKRTGSQFKGFQSKGTIGKTGMLNVKQAKKASPIGVEWDARENADGTWSIHVLDDVGNSVKTEKNFPTKYEAEQYGADLDADIRMKQTQETKKTGLSKEKTVEPAKAQPIKKVTLREQIKQDIDAGKVDPRLATVIADRDAMLSAIDNSELDPTLKRHKKQSVNGLTAKTISAYYKLQADVGLAMVELRDAKDAEAHAVAQKKANDLQAELEFFYKDPVAYAQGKRPKKEPIRAESKPATKAEPKPEKKVEAKPEKKNAERMQGLKDQLGIKTITAEKLAKAGWKASNTDTSLEEIAELVQRADHDVTTNEVGDEILAEIELDGKVVATMFKKVEKPVEKPVKKKVSKPESEQKVTKPKSQHQLELEEEERLMDERAKQMDRRNEEASKLAGLIKKITSAKRKNWRERYVDETNAVITYASQLVAELEASKTQDTADFVNKLKENLGKAKAMRDRIASGNFDENMTREEFYGADNKLTELLKAYETYSSQKKKGNTINPSSVMVKVLPHEDLTADEKMLIVLTRSISGRELFFFESETNNSYFGFTSPTHLSDVVYANRNIKDKRMSQIFQVVSHEVTHVMRKLGPSVRKAFDSAVFKAMNLTDASTDQDYIDTLAKFYEQFGEKPEIAKLVAKGYFEKGGIGSVKEEIVAHSGGVMLTSKAFWNYFSSFAKTKWNAIKGYITGHLDVAEQLFPNEKGIREMYVAIQSASELGSTYTEYQADAEKIKANRQRVEQEKARTEAEAKKEQQRAEREAKKAEQDRIRQAKQASEVVVVQGNNPTVPHDGKQFVFYSKNAKAEEEFKKEISEALGTKIANNTRRVPDEGRLVKLKNATRETRIKNFVESLLKIEGSNFGLNAGSEINEVFMSEKRDHNTFNPTELVNYLRNLQYRTDMQELALKEKDEEGYNVNNDDTIRDGMQAIERVRNTIASLLNSMENEGWINSDNKETLKMAEPLSEAFATYKRKMHPDEVEAMEKDRQRREEEIKMFGKNTWNGNIKEQFDGFDNKRIESKFNRNRDVSEQTGETLASEIKSKLNRWFARGGIDVSYSLGNFRRIFEAFNESNSAADRSAENFLRVIYGRMDLVGKKIFDRGVYIFDLLEDIQLERIKPRKVKIGDTKVEVYGEYKMTLEEIAREKDKIDQYIESRPELKSAFDERRELFKQITDMIVSEGDIAGLELRPQFDMRNFYFRHISMDYLMAGGNIVKLTSGKIKALDIDKRRALAKDYLTDPLAVDVGLYKKLVREYHRLQLYNEIMTHNKNRDKKFLKQNNIVFNGTNWVVQDPKTKKVSALPKEWYQIDVSLLGMDPDFVDLNYASQRYMTAVATTHAMARLGFEQGINKRGKGGKLAQIDITTDKGLEMYQRMRRKIDENRLKIKGDNVLILPADIAKAIESEMTPKHMNEIPAIVKKVSGRLKGWYLYSFHNAFKYQFKNMGGDLEGALMTYPEMVAYKIKGVDGQMRNVIHEAYNQVVGVMYKGRMMKDMRNYIWQGGFGSSMQEVELANIQQDPDFKHLYESETDADVLDVVNRVFKVWAGQDEQIKKLSDTREQVLRYAMYLYQLDTLRDNYKKTGKALPKQYGASRREEIMSIKSLYGRAFKLANDAIGAYNNVTPITKWLSDSGLMLFPRFTEVNARRFVRTVRNVWLGDNPDFVKVQGSTFAKAVGIAKPTAFAVMRLGLLSMKLSLLWSIPSVLSAFIGGEDDDKLPDDIKAKPHLTLPAWLSIDGKAHYITDISAIAQFFESVGVDLGLGLSLVRQVSNGQVTLAQAAKEMVGVVPSNLSGELVSSMNPLLKAIFEYSSGKSFYPDPTRPRSIRDFGLYTFQQFGLQREYKILAGLPDGSIGAVIADNVYGEFFNSAVRGDLDIWYIRDLRTQFESRMGKGQFEITRSDSIEANRANAAYNYKLALKLKDKAAAEKYLTQYALYGGTGDGLAKSIASLDPTYGMKDSDRKAFINWLSDEDVERYKEARSYINELKGRSVEYRRD